MKGNIQPTIENMYQSLENTKGLTSKQKDFCLYYVLSSNATQAYLKAYGGKYNTACVEAYKNLRKPKIKAKIKELRELIRDDIDISKSDMITFLVKAVKADIRDYMKFDQDKIILKDMEGVDTSLIQEVKQTNTGIHIKLIDKVKAWEKLALILGWINEDMTEDTPIINDNIPDFSQLTKEELLELTRLAFSEESKADDFKEDEQHAQ